MTSKRAKRKVRKYRRDLAKISKKANRLRDKAFEMNDESKKIFDRLQEMAKEE